MEYTEEFLIEQQYLEKTCAFIDKNLQQELSSVSDEKGKIIDARREMWENVSFKGGFNNAAEANQALEILQAQAASYDAAHQRIDRYRLSLEKPYFARVDFFEESNGHSDPVEKIYIGLATMMDDDTYETYVYDWRAPISSIFYRYEIGPVKYQAPSGEIGGTVSLKRQYEINHSHLNYFFDSNVNIVDDMLRTALSQNTSPTMKNIVETIQRQQDMIIRDIQNELVIVQGVAGSGKTSVALHRVAFLLYEGVAEKLHANNILIISPNNLFGSYIGNVLPELGEENIASLTFEAIFQRVVKQDIFPSSRNDLLEAMISGKSNQRGNRERSLLWQEAEFKSSATFVVMLNRLLSHFSHKLISFTDIYYNGRLIESKEAMRDFLLSSNRKIPIEKSLQLIEKRIWTAIHAERKNRMPKLLEFATSSASHLYHARQYARLVSIKESMRIKHQIEKFTTVESLELYRLLLEDRALFHRLAKGLPLPHDIDDILDFSQSSLCANPSSLPYEDVLPVLYLDILLCGNGSIFSNIRQVVVDEAQDYSAVHFEVLRALFPNARYTVMGDINQTIGKESTMALYDEIEEILAKKATCRISLNKGFRCSSEISDFSRRFLDNDDIESFDRHEEAPLVIACKDESEMVSQIVAAAQRYREAGLGSVGIICKSREETHRLHEALKGLLTVSLLDTNRREVFSGVMLLPVYMAKGLEFDGAILYGADDSSYCTELDKKLLYVSSTRALHRLTVLYTGKASRFLNV